MDLRILVKNLITNKIDDNSSSIFICENFEKYIINSDFMMNIDVIKLLYTFTKTQEKLIVLKYGNCLWNVISGLCMMANKEKKDFTNMVLNTRLFIENNLNVLKSFKKFSFSDKSKIDGISCDKSLPDHIILREIIERDMQLKKIFTEEMLLACRIFIEYDLEMPYDLNDINSVTFSYNHNLNVLIDKHVDLIEICNILIYITKFFNGK